MLSQRMNSAPMPPGLADAKRVARLEAEARAGRWESSTGALALAEVVERVVQLGRYAVEAAPAALAAVAPPAEEAPPRTSSAVSPSASAEKAARPPPGVEEEGAPVGEEQELLMGAEAAAEEEAFAAVAPPAEEALPRTSSAVSPSASAEKAARPPPGVEEEGAPVGEESRLGAEGAAEGSSSTEDAAAEPSAGANFAKKQSMTSSNDIMTHAMMCCEAGEGAHCFASLQAREGVGEQRAPQATEQRTSSRRFVPGHRGSRMASTAGPPPK